MIASIHRTRARRKLLPKAADSLRSVYRKLSLCLEQVQEFQTHLENIYDKACLAVLEDDLNSLLEECEEYLVCGSEDCKKAMCSFRCRTETVIEEVRMTLAESTLH